MNNRQAIIFSSGIAIVVLAGIWFYYAGQGATVGSRIKSGAKKIMAGGGKLVTEAINYTLGERNNNPGNLRLTSVPWVGQASAQPGPFVVFSSPVYGIRALAKNLLTYYQNYGLDTVSGIISRWSPPSENNTAEYIQAVSQSMGVSPDVPLQVTNPVILQNLVRAIIQHENGRVIYSQNIISNGVAMA